MQFQWATLQEGTLPLTPDSRFRAEVEHRCTSVLIWPNGCRPTPDNTLLTDPCFTARGFVEAVDMLASLGISFEDIGQTFLTHGHMDHVTTIPNWTVARAFRAAPLHTIPRGAATIPCPGHAKDLECFVFRGPDAQEVWVVGDAILNEEWLRAWCYYWPNQYNATDICETWRSVARILSSADVVLPGHGAPIQVDAGLLDALICAFPAADSASECADVLPALESRRNDLRRRETALAACNPHVGETFP